MAAVLRRELASFDGSMQRATTVCRRRRRTAGLRRRRPHALPLKGASQVSRTSDHGVSQPVGPPSPETHHVRYDITTGGRRCPVAKTPRGRMSTCTIVAPPHGPSIRSLSAIFANSRTARPSDARSAGNLCIVMRPKIW